MKNLLVEYVYDRGTGKQFGLYLDAENTVKVFDKLKKVLNNVREDVLKYFEVVWQAEERLNDYLCTAFDTDFGDVIIRPERIVLTLNNEGLKRFRGYPEEEFTVVLTLDDDKQVGFVGEVAHYGF